MSHVALCCLVVAFAFGASVRDPASAEGFRIETKIFVGDEKEPVSKTTTLFLDGVVYDFLAKPEQTAVFRKPTGGKPGRFILLNDKRAHSDGSLDRTARRRDEQAAQLGPRGRRIRSCNSPPNPEFDETFDRDSGKLVLASHLETYTVDTKPTAAPGRLGRVSRVPGLVHTAQHAAHAPAPPPEPRLQAERRARAAQSRSR